MRYLHKLQNKVCYNNFNGTQLKKCINFFSNKYL